jgi:L-ribulose-5-phosphate 3-epimerase
MPENGSMTRRDLIVATAQVVVNAALAPRLLAAAAMTAPLSAATREASTPSFLLFSKHLPELDWGALGRAVKAAGFDGIDLTVRSQGHVAPERAAEDLPRAIEAIAAQELTVPMITTELVSAESPTARPILQAAAKSGVRYFKTGYWRYTSAPNRADVRAQVAAAGAALAGLAALATEYGIALGFHNHAGYIGAPLWDIAPAMDRLEPRWAGYYFDPRHAVADGGGGSWRAATELAASRLKMLAVKDCYWVKSPKGWVIENCPLGEGMVDWPAVAAIVRATQFAGPISVHLEYPIQPGTEHTLAAARRDLAVAKKYFG